jgi:iron complex transport system substrate-binding protein
MIRAAALAVAASQAAWVGADANALQLRDDRGVTITLARPAERIVTLSPHLAEIAFAAGAGAKLVGVSTFSRHPAEAERLPVVASYGRVDIERLIALRPQLVLGWQSGNSPLQIGRLERLGMPVFVTETRSLADIARIIRLVGALAGSADRAEARARRFESEVAELRERHAGERSIAVFLEVWHTPMLTVNGEHLASDALRLCGGRNVFAAAKALTPLASREQLLAAAPEAIVTAGFGADAPQAWRGFDAVAAVRHHRIYAIDPDLLYGQGPSFLEGARALCERLERARN